VPNRAISCHFHHLPAEHFFLSGQNRTFADTYPPIRSDAQVYSQVQSRSNESVACPFPSSDLGSLQRKQGGEANLACAAGRKRDRRTGDFGPILKFASRPFLTGLFDFDFFGFRPNLFSQKEKGNGIANRFKNEGLGEGIGSKLN